MESVTVRALGLMYENHREYLSGAEFEVAPDRAARLVELGMVETVGRKPKSETAAVEAPQEHKAITKPEGKKGKRK